MTRHLRGSAKRRAPAPAVLVAVAIAIAAGPLSSQVELTDIPQHCTRRPQDGERAYRDYGDRCEGLVGRPTAGSDITIVSYTVGEAPLVDDAGAPVNLETCGGTGNAMLRVMPFPRDRTRRGYEITRYIPAGRSVWNLRSALREEAPPADLAITARTSRDQSASYLPVAASGCDGDRYLGFVSTLDLRAPRLRARVDAVPDYSQDAQRPRYRRQQPIWFVLRSEAFVRGTPVAITVEAVPDEECPGGCPAIRGSYRILW